MSTTEKTTLDFGTVLGNKWVILEFIAKGGMGEVYRAHQTNLNRDVAIKVISKEWLECIVEDDEERETALLRFKREVKAMAGIQHPNALRIFDYGTEMIKDKAFKEPLHYIAMEYIPGDTLRETMSEQGFYPETDLTRDWIEKYFVPVLDGVEAVHKRDMVHRDLKPENILIDGEIPKITDFGLARSCRWKGITQSIDIKGTIVYMPPEQFADFRRVDHRADIYSLGKILYEAIVGKISATSKSTHFKHVGLNNPETGFFQEIDQIIRKATAESKEERFTSIEEFRKAILNALVILTQQPDEKLVRTIFEHPTWIWAGISVSIAAVVVMTLWHLLGNPGSSPPATLSDQVIDSDSERSGLQIEMDLRSPIIGPDNVSLRYVPGGTLLLPDNRLVEIESFYMDETPVTNMQYVDFLNQISSRITVSNNAVSEDGKILLLLGEITESYDPIVYKGGQFVIEHAGHAACPVLRVTAFGASAYTRFYGKRLPSDTEWLHAYQGASESSNDLLEVPSEFKPILTPVIQLAPNPLGIRGLNQSINEWITRSFKMQSDDSSKGPVYAVIGNVLKTDEKTVWYSTAERQPFESFGEVGFRGVMDIAVVD
jgi:eukaryotic-like serine/threonine-protein kinase